MARPPKSTATISIDDPSPHHGDTIVLSVEADVETLTHVVCVNGDGIALSSGGEVRPAGSYDQAVTLVSPSYASGRASCTATVKEVVVKGTKHTLREIASLDFLVEA